MTGHPARSVPGDPVTGIEANFGVGRAETAVAIAKAIVEPGEVVVEQAGNTAGFITRDVLLQWPQGLGRYDQRDREVGRLGLHHALWILCEKGMTWAVVAGDQQVGSV